jgi:hypothetical protein
VFATVLVAAVVPAAVARADNPAPGSFDPAFGTNGVVTNVEPNLSFDVRAQGVDTGGIWTAGATFNAAKPRRTGHPFLRRYHSNGQPDRALGRAGTLVLPFAGFIASGFDDSQGRLVAVVDNDDAGTQTVCRFLPDGTIDAAFGGGCIGSGATAVLPREDDGALVVEALGPTSHGVHLAAYLSDGQLDASFAQGAGEATVTPPPHTHRSGATVTQLANDDLVIAWIHDRFLGSTGTRAELFDEHLARVSPFARDGVFVSTDAVGAWTLAGKYLYALSTPLHGTESLLRLKLDGSVDHSFGANGRLDLVAALGDAQYQLLGATGPSLYLGVTPTSGGGGGAIERIGLDGTPDPSFGSGGVSQLVQPSGVETVEPEAVSFARDRLTVFVTHVYFPHETTQYGSSIQRFFR